MIVPRHLPNKKAYDGSNLKGPHTHYRVKISKKEDLILRVKILYMLLGQLGAEIFAIRY